MKHNHQHKNESLFNLDTPKNKELRKCYLEMGKNQREPFENIVVDGKSHLCQMHVIGNTRGGFYQASWEPFGNQGPLLICSYGLLEDKNAFTYPSSHH